MIDKIGDQCTGCEACANICPKDCISMVENAEGFLFPKIDSGKCVGCELCEKACPVLSPIPIHKTQEDVKVYALIHKDEDVRSHSSSGGAFSAIADFVLEQGGVVFGAAFDENFEVHHICVDKPEDLYKLRGSKYVQSRIGDAYRQAKEKLQQGRLVFFTGTACQTSGLLGFLGRDYENLITQDLICHGVPSPLAWRKYIQLNRRWAKSEVEHIFFRDKIFGWHNWHVSIDDPHLIWDETSWSYKIPKTVPCDYCGELELGNEGWIYLINYTSTPTQLNTPGTFDYENKVTVDGQTAWGWSNFEHGEIVERGTHEELLQMEGRYYELYTGVRELD